MSDQHHPLSGGQQCVTASDLVRHFGVWQDRAGRAPIYILHRGRPRLVLTSLDVMDALCGPHTVAGNTQDVTALLDADDRVMIVIDAHGLVRHASHGARQRFGEKVAAGSPAASLAEQAGDQLTDAIERVAASGHTESIEIALRRYPDRRANCRIAPFPDGCIVTIDDATAIEDAQTLRQRHTAALAAIDSAGAIVTRVSARDYLVEPPASLSDVSGIAPDTLAAARFVSLFDVGDRVAIGEAVERVLDGQSTTRMSAMLIVRGAAARPMTIGLAPIAEGQRVVAAAAALVPCGVAA